MRCIEAPDIGYLVVWGVSNNTRSYWETTAQRARSATAGAERGGLCGRDPAQPNPLDPVAQRFQGGSFVTIDYTPPERRA